jgi:geranylgeranyl pyrophosphate synthase
MSPNGIHGDDQQTGLGYDSAQRQTVAPNFRHLDAGKHLGKSSADYELGICLSELIHTGSLIIDDIQDQSELRRGRPSLYRTYGIDVAINAGNTLYFLPFVELMHHKHMTAEQKLQMCIR